MLDAASMNEITNEMWDGAFKWASNIYGGKRDKQDKPLMLHALRVMTTMQMYGETHMLVGLLHDTIEEAEDVELATVVLHNFPPPIVRAVLAITRRSPERYFDYIRRVSLNEIATAVKLADLADNLDLTRGTFEGQETLRERYRRSAAFLRTGDEAELARPLVKGF
jgi:(p)ppGpp synthase/HD superfamily hydrolase